MKNQTHILNGDSLKEQFPEAIRGNIIVARECLVDGNVEGKDLKELYQSRAEYLSKNYGGTIRGYYEKTVNEFEKINNIHYDSDINLWFEDDLFCQVNFWFTVYLLIKKKRDHRIYLIRPVTHTEYGFAGLSTEQLISIYEKKIELKELDKIASLWLAYQNNEIAILKTLAGPLTSYYPFIQDVVDAHIARLPLDSPKSRPVQSLRKIMKDLKTEEFGPVFKEFCKQENIYGYGDLQVKGLYNQIINK